MKKLFTALIFLIGIVSYGQSLNSVNKRIMVDTIRAIGNLRVPYTGATTAVNLGSNGLTTTGTGTVGILKVGDAASNTILSADSISTDGTTFLVFDGATQLSPNIPASGQGELGIYSRLLTDTIPIFVFGLGSGQAGDTAVFNDNAIAGAFWNNESDTLVITSLMGVLAAGSGTETIDVQVSWHTNLKDGSATNLNSSAYTITSITAGDEDTSFANAEIPPKQWVWCTISGTSAGNRPSMLILTLSGYYKNQSW